MNERKIYVPESGPIGESAELPSYEEPKAEYCLELKEIWSQFSDRIKWVNGDYSSGYVRIGDINIANIVFWEEMVSWRLGSRGEEEMTGDEKERAELARDYYWGHRVKILSLATGEEIRGNYTIDYGDEAFLDKKDWTWKDAYEVDITGLIKKVGRAMKYIEVWCS